jgi:hypothetical protein
MRRRRIIYLHGFASGPGSSKAKYFAENCRALGLNIVIPDLNEPSFASMTLSSQIALVDDEVKRAEAENESLTLIGSSMGGLIAVLSSLRHKSIDRLILLAPAFAIQYRWQALWTKDKLDEWQKSGQLDVYHYGYQKDMRLGSAFIADLANHKTEDLKIEIPAMVFHGRADDIVPVDLSIGFAANNPSVTLHVLDDDHQLLSSVPLIWNMRREILLSSPTKKC